MTAGARVPFALVGCLLLVASGTFVGSLHYPPAGQPSVDEAIDRTGAATQSALRDAVVAAGRRAARDPVTDPAATAVGRVLDRSRTFRAYLRLRIYLAARENLARLSGRRSGLSVEVSLPATPTPGSLVAAKRRVSIDRAGSGRLTVTISNVTILARRGERVVGRRTVSPTLTVPTPVLTVHDRVRRFERRLNAGALDPGLGRRLTARLYPVVWARGYAQYGGVPIENVLANRHVGLLANGAILALQRDVFGHSDPAGRAVLSAATRDLAVADLLAGAEYPFREYLRDAHAPAGLTASASDPLAEVRDAAPPPERAVTVGVNATADRAFAATLATLDGTLRDAYGAEIRLRARVRKLDTERADPQPVGDGWRRLSENREVETAVARRPADTLPLPDGWHALSVHSRTVTRTTRVDRTFRADNRTVTRTARTIERFAVDVVLAGNHTAGQVPRREIRTIHERGGPLGGPNMADVGPRASARLIESRGGVDAIARRAVDGSVDPGSLTLVGERPTGLRRWVYEDLASLRERVRNVSVTTTRGSIATLRSNPAVALLAELRERRSTLLDVPDTYDSVADRARVAARAAYLDRVEERLRERARRARTVREGLASRLDARLAATPGSGASRGHIRARRDHASLNRLQGGYQRRRNRSGSPLPALAMQVDASPAYLTREAVGAETVPALNRSEHPLVVRNWNALAVPYGDVADAVVEAVLGPDTVRLRTAAAVLRTASGRGIDGENRSRLRRQVRSGNARVASRAVATLAETSLGTPGARRALVRDALSRWESPGPRALALTNGSAVDAIHRAAVGRWPDALDGIAGDRLAVDLRLAVRDALDDEDVRPNQPPVDATTRQLHEAVETEVKAHIADLGRNAGREALEEVAGTSLARLPAGLPVAPVPGLWYGTVNVWHVEVAGEYARFAVRVPRGTPDVPGGFRYVRDGHAVALDVDGDGTPERLGTSERVSFSTSTLVGVAVPPGSRGVGDVDGQADERSPGWPSPGPVEGG